MKIVITAQFFFEPTVFVVNIVEDLGDVLHEVEGRDFDFQGLDPRFRGGYEDRIEPIELA